MIRPNINTWAIRLAEVTSSRSTCLRRHVGCVLLDREGRVLSTGYNGVASGLQHCDELGKCAERSESPSGVDLNKCNSVHAEQNALIQCPDVDKVFSAYVSTSPCISCLKLFMNSGCQNIYFREEYDQPESKLLWLKVPGHTWLKILS